MAAVTLYRSYLWLVDTIYNAIRITREEIDRKWAQSHLNETHASRLPERTFHRWREAVQEIFGITIACDKSQGNIYFIRDRERLANSSTYRWLLNTLSVAQLVSDNRQIQDKILLEDMPSDTLYLSPLMEAIRTGHVVRIDYQPFGKPAPHTVELQPYCLKAFRRRWYVVGKSSSSATGLRSYCLDRIKQLTVLERTYSIPEDFDAHEYFRDYFGICRNNYTTTPQRLVLEVLEPEADYLRSLPLHHSQREIEQKDGFVYFEYHMVPTFDLFQELQMHGSAIRVIEPDIFAYWIKKEAEMIYDDYKDFDDKKFEAEHPEQAGSAD